MSAKKIYKVLVVGTGKRGKHHALAFKNNPRFELAGLADSMPEQLAKASAELGIHKTSLHPLDLQKKFSRMFFVFAPPPASGWNSFGVGSPAAQS